jgi:hypothetical protein
VNSASANPNVHRSKQTVDDEGFTLTEMVVALIIMFGALIASSQVVISMVKATLYSRHADYAVTLATQVMEDAVSNDCGGRLPDNRDTPRNRWISQIERCQFLPTPFTDVSRCKTGPTTYFNDWDAGSLGTLRAENDLGRRYFVKVVGTVAYCVSVDVQWVPLKWTANAATNNMRLQRTVRVQWVEPNKKDTRRERMYTQVAALPPDAVQSGNIGRLDIFVGTRSTPSSPANTVTILSPLPPSITRASDDPTLTLSADQSGWVHIPYLPTDWTQKVGTTVTVTPSFIVDMTYGGSSRQVTLSASSYEFCTASSSAAPTVRSSTGSYAVGTGATTC